MDDPTNNCLDVAIITAAEKRTKKTIIKTNCCWEAQSNIVHLIML